jgi:hypothetical protein
MDGVSANASPTPCAVPPWEAPLAWAVLLPEDACMAACLIGLDMNSSDLLNDSFTVSDASLRLFESFSEYCQPVYH